MRLRIFSRKIFVAAVMSCRNGGISMKKKFENLKIQEFFDNFIQSGSHDVNFFWVSLSNIFSARVHWKAESGEKQAL